MSEKHCTYDLLRAKIAKLETTRKDLLSSIGEQTGRFVKMKAKIEELEDKIAQPPCWTHEDKLRFQGSIEDEYKKTNDRMRKDRDTYKNLSKDQAQCIDKLNADIETLQAKIAELEESARVRDIIIDNDKLMLFSRQEDVIRARAAEYELRKSLARTEDALTRANEILHGYGSQTIYPHHCFQYGGSPACDADNERNGLECPLCERERS